MKTTLLLFFTIISFSLSAQTTHNLGWANDGNSNNQSIWIEQGDTIIWTWGSGTHNLRSTSGTESFDSGYFTVSGSTFTYTFNQVGSTDYVCDPHAGNMNGTVTVTSTAGISENKLLSFEMYPNPANDLLNIKVQNGFEGEFKIYDMQGKLLMIENLLGSDQLSIIDLSVGMYIVQIISKQGDVATSRLSVSR